MIFFSEIVDVENIALPGYAFTWITGTEYFKEKSYLSLNKILEYKLYAII